MIEWVHPSFLFFLGALLLPFVKGKVKSILLLGIPVVSLLLLLLTSEGSYGNFSIAGQNVIFGRVDRLALVFGYVFTLMAFIGETYSFHVKEDGQHMAAFFYVGSSLGVVFAGDFLSLFLFWEIMAFSSTLLVWYGGKKSEGAGFRYLLVHIFGGVILLAGIILQGAQTGSIAFDRMTLGSLATYLILIGFMLNAGVPPLHAWLPDAYPEATITGAVFLCAYTTKTAVYTLVRGFPGTEILVPLGVAMALYGVVYAVLENDARRLLAYHIISQVGYMVTGVGMGTDMALNGAVAHAYSHILYKGLLFMGIGAVVQQTGKRKLSELGGLYQKMPVTFWLYMIGGLSISAFPLFSGFVSKSMVVSAGAEGHRPAVVLLLTLASAGTFLHTGLKLPYYIWFGKNSGLTAKEPPKNMLIAMALGGFFCILIGVYPTFLYQSLPYPVDYHPYTGEHVAGALGMLLFTAVGFFLLLKKLDPEPTISIDTDWFYRKGSQAFLWFAHNPLTRYEGFATEAYRFAIIEPAKRFSELLWRFDTWVIDGIVNGAAALTLLESKILHMVDVYIVDAVVNAAGWMTLLESRISEIFDIYVVDGSINGIFSEGLDYSARKLRRLQTGAIQNYILAMVVGVVVLVLIFTF